MSLLPRLRRIRSLLFGLCVLAWSTGQLEAKARWGGLLLDIPEGWEMVPSENSAECASWAGALISRPVTLTIGITSPDVAGNDLTRWAGADAFERALRRLFPDRRVDVREFVRTVVDGLPAHCALVSQRTPAGYTLEQLVAIVESEKTYVFVFTASGTEATRAIPECWKLLEATRFEVRPGVLRSMPVWWCALLLGSVTTLSAVGRWGMGRWRRSAPGVVIVPQR